MKFTNQTPAVFELDVTLPDFMVKTHHGNVHLKSLIGNKHTVMYTNPVDLLPKNEEERLQLCSDLEKLKKLNFHIMGFNKGSFHDHLKCINWVNSYLKEDMIFPIFYEPITFEKQALDSSLIEEKEIVKPVYLIDNKGTIKVILNGTKPENRKLNKILDIASKLVLADQDLQRGISVNN